ncbi:hypothetical protein Closa_0985 [[Clostridium] saccharolyticum WM1]|uniref:Uncharacterized protein n=1 Tax=Lacrimispora saccharolytica (strain ATCC 35040 / DSM 2544 / NRCC 2533 / WM1) TaxID=610130 RepID=D9R6U7_LACSW|nr:hypothetical protein Closa_0985 [[Clostridium] saccharolyticum WM1]
MKYFPIMRSRNSLKILIRKALPPIMYWRMDRKEEIVIKMSRNIP